MTFVFEFTFFVDALFCTFSYSFLLFQVFWMKL